MNGRRMARRTAGWSPSATLALMAEAARRRRAGQDIVDFSVGEPDFRTPEPICAAAVRALREGFTHYTPAAGIPELREAIAERYRERTGAGYPPSQVVVGCGGKHLLWEIFFALFEEGDEVLLPSPYWASFPEQIRMAGAEPVVVPTRPEDGFVPRPDALEAACTARTRGVLVNSPCNPTGAVWSRGVLDSVASLAADRDLWVISDETYDRFLYDGAEHHSLAGLGAFEDRLLVVNSFSKTYAMTGWRVGYALGPARVMRAVEALGSQQTSGTNSIAQRAALAALRGDPGPVGDAVASMLQAFTARRRVVLDALRQVPGAEAPDPLGAFYVFPDVRQALERNGFPDDLALARHLLDTCGVALVPGSAFGAPGFVRLSFALPESDLCEGTRRLADALR